MTLAKWIAKTKLHCQRTQKSANKTRERSAYTDIDALEDSCRAEGAIIALDALTEAIASGDVTLGEKARK
jgi:hypothetical protein